MQASPSTITETVFFTDAAMHRTYKWNADASKAELLTDQVKTPMAVAFAGNGTLLALDYSKSVFGVNTKIGRGEED